MAMNIVLQYTQLNQQYIKIGPVFNALTPTLPLTGATVVATLYSGRVPGGDPGTEVPGATGIVLADIGNGYYQGQAGSNMFNPAIGTNYITTVDLTTSGGGQAHWEIPSTVSPRSY
jgi:hypothetical protein